MTADEFRYELRATGFTQNRFAEFVGSNERTVRRWAAGEQDIPPWVSVIFRLLHLLESEQDHSPRAVRAL